MTATPPDSAAAPAKPFGATVGESDTSGFLSSMMKQLGTDTKPAPEDPTKPIAVVPPAPAATAAPAKSAAPATAPAAASEDDMPPEIKSEKAKEGWREVKKNLAEARKAEAELKAKVADYEKKLAESAAPRVPEELNQRLAALQKEADDLSERLRVADVERHPRFQQYFEGKTAALTEAAKAVVGTEHVAKLERILKVADDEARTNLLDELMGEITPSRAARLGAVIADIEALQRERAAEIGKSKERWTQLQAQTQAEQTAKLREREALADRLVSAATEMEAFKLGDGADAARAAEVETYKTFVKQALTGRLEGQDEQFMPLMAVEGLHLKAKVVPALLAKVADLEKRIADINAAQPRPGGGGSGEQAGDKPKGFLDVMRTAGQ